MNIYSLVTDLLVSLEAPPDQFDLNLTSTTSSALEDADGPK